MAMIQNGDDTVHLRDCHVGAMHLEDCNDGAIFLRDDNGARMDMRAYIGDANIASLQYGEEKEWEAENDGATTNFDTNSGVTVFRKTKWRRDYDMKKELRLANIMDTEWHWNDIMLTKWQWNQHYAHRMAPENRIVKVVIYIKSEWLCLRLFDCVFVC